MSEPKKYWEFKNKTDKEAELYLYIEIASWGGGYSAHSAQSFKDELDALGNIEKLTIFMNCEGGDVFEGVAIRNMLQRKSYQKVAYVDGLAASIASDILTACDYVYMYQNTMQMVHNAWGTCRGYADEMEQYATTLRKISQNIKQDYINRSNGKLDEETITKLMDAESWLSAQECLNYGLCDEVINQSMSITNKAEALNHLGYKNIPKNLGQKAVNSVEEQHQKNQEEEDDDQNASCRMALSRARAVLERYEINN